MSESFLEENYYLNQLSNTYQQIIANRSDGSIDQGAELFNYSAQLDEFFVFHQLKTYCEFLALSTGFKSKAKDQKPFFYIQILEWVDKQSDLPISIKTYHECIKLFKRGQQEEKEEQQKERKEQQEENKQLIQINNILELLDHKDQVLNDWDKVYILSILTSFCIKLINTENQDLNPMVFDLYNRMICIKHEGSKIEMMPSIFRNVIALALQLENDPLFKDLKTPHIKQNPPFNNGIQWAKLFLKAYWKKLPEVGALSHKTYSEAFIFFHEKKFDKANDVISRLNRVQGASFPILLKILYLKILFELNYPSRGRKYQYEILMESKFDSFRQQIKYEEKNKKRLTYQQDMFRAFLKWYGVLWSIYKDWLIRGIDEKKIELKKQSLLDEINSTNYSFKEWFVQKIEAVKKN